MTVKHKNIDVILDFHVFDVQDFDFMIGHPIEKLLMDALTQGKLDVRLGKKTVSVQISRATNSMAEPSLETEPIMEVTSFLPFDHQNPSLKKMLKSLLKRRMNPQNP